MKEEPDYGKFHEEDPSLHHEEIRQQIRESISPIDGKPHKYLIRYKVTWDDDIEILEKVPGEPEDLGLVEEDKKEFP